MGKEDGQGKSVPVVEDMEERRVRTGSMEDEQKSDRQLQIRNLAAQIMGLAHDGILINMRFLDVALSKLNVACR